MNAEEKWPYSLPIFRRSFGATSPNGATIAEIRSAKEVGMSNPTSGTLELSTGLTFRNCNPSFIWSDDSKHLAVAEWSLKAALFRGQRLLVVEAGTGQVFASGWVWGFLQPESFTGGELVVVRNTTRKKPKRILWPVPAGLAGFTRRGFAA